MDIRIPNLASKATKLSVFLVFFGLASIVTQSGGGEIKLTYTPTPVELAISISQIRWKLPAEQTPVFCVGSLDIFNLRFRYKAAKGANTKEVAIPETQKYALLSATKSIDHETGFPAIELSQLSPVQRSLNGLILTCTGESSEPSSHSKKSAGIPREYSAISNHSVDAVIEIEFLDKPFITTTTISSDIRTGKQSVLPVLSGIHPTVLYVKRGSSLRLKCDGQGNPPPRRWTWSVDGRVFHNGQILSVSGRNGETNRLINASIQCSHTNPNGESKGSLTVKIASLEQPKILTQSFVNPINQRNNQFIGRFTRFGDNIFVSCTASGNPRPSISWFQTAAKTVSAKPVSCSKFTQSTVGNYSDYNHFHHTIQSTCQLTASDYDLSGKYWCQACSQSTEDSSCSKPNSKLLVDIIGPPVFTWKNVTRVTVEAQIRIQVTVCSNPPINRHFWTVGDQSKVISKHGQTLHANSSQHCVILSLLISEDQNHVSLTAVNAHGNSTLLILQNTFIQSVHPVHAHGHKISFIIGITVAVIIGAFVIIGSVIFCWAAGLFTKDDKIVTGRPPPNDYQTIYNAPNSIQIKETVIKPPHRSSQAQLIPFETLDERGGRRDSIAISEESAVDGIMPIEDYENEPQSPTSPPTSWNSEMSNESSRHLTMERQQLVTMV